MKKISRLGGAALALALLAGCSFHARGPDEYKKDTRALLETKEGEIRSCYEELLKSDKDASGKVVLTFVVKHESGAISDVKVKNEGKTSEELSACVTKAVEGLKLDPPDQRDGHAEFTWEFKTK